jgi:nucleotide-binding universal stress UspA family protein
LDEIDHELHFLVGAAYLVIPRIAKGRQIDVSVIGSSSHTAEPGHFIGTTAENIIQKIGCSLLTIKPSGFPSPVGPS